MQEKMIKYFESFKTNEQVQKKVNEILQNEKYKQESITPSQIQLKSIDTDNFVNIKKIKIDFETNKIIIIQGDNGRGKTLTTELITLMLNNYGRDKLNNLVSRETRSRLDFYIMTNDDKRNHSIVIEKGTWSELINGVVGLKKQTDIMKKYNQFGIDEIFRQVIKISDSKSYITNKEGAEFKLFFMDFYNISFADDICIDIRSSIKLNKTQIDNLHVDKARLSGNDEDGPNLINVKLATIEKELSQNENIKKEYTDIITKGNEGIIKIQNNIKDLNEKKSKKDELLAKVESVVVNKDVFKNLAEKQNELKKLNKEIVKAHKLQAKYHNEVTDYEIQIEGLNKNIKVLEHAEGKCEICDSELSLIRKQLILKDKQEKIDTIKKSIEKANSNLKKSFDSEPVPVQLENEIEGFNDILVELNDINVKSQKGIDQILEKYRIPDIEVEIKQIVTKIEEKNKQLNVLMEKSPAKRKAELESQLNTHEKLKSELAVWNEKKNTYEKNKIEIEEINKKLKFAEFQDEILNKVLDIFDKNLMNSYPIWHLNSSIKEIETEVNQELDKFKKLGLKLKIGDDFSIIVKGLNRKALSSSELKIVNFIFKLVVAKQRFKIIPFMIVDEYKNSLDKNTLINFKEVINYYIKNKYINNVILTEPTESSELVIKGMEKI